MRRLQLRPVRIVLVGDEQSVIAAEVDRRCGGRRQCCRDAIARKERGKDRDPTNPCLPMRRAMRIAVIHHFAFIRSSSGLSEGSSWAAYCISSIARLHARGDSIEYAREGRCRGRCPPRPDWPAGRMRAPRCTVLARCRRSRWPATTSVALPSGRFLVLQRFRIREDGIIELAGFFERRALRKRRLRFYDIRTAAIGHLANRPGVADRLRQPRFRVPLKNHRDDQKDAEGGKTGSGRRVFQAQSDVASLGIHFTAVARHDTQDEQPIAHRDTGHARNENSQFIECSVNDECHTGHRPQCFGRSGALRSTRVRRQSDWTPPSDRNRSERNRHSIKSSTNINKIPTQILVFLN